MGELSQHTVSRLLFLCFHVPRCSTRCQKMVRWYLGNCRIWGREPESSRVPTISRGRDAMMLCQPASHHTGLPARPRSPAKSVLIMDRMTNSSLSHMHSALLRTEGDNVRDPVVQSQRSWFCWEVSWWGPHKCGPGGDTSVLCTGSYDRTRSICMRKANSIRSRRSSWSPLVDGWIITSLCSIYIVLLWPFKNRRRCDDSQVRSDDQNSEEDVSHFLVALNDDRTSILGLLASCFASNGTWNVLMS